MSRLSLLIVLGLLLMTDIPLLAQGPNGLGRPKLSPSFIKKIDKDGDGKVSEEEMKQAKGEGARQMQARRQEMREFKEAEKLRKFDLDKDGKLSEAEEKLASESQQDAIKVYRKKMLLRYDKNNNGTIDTEEYRSAVGDRLAGRMKPFDKDGDGHLNSEEQAALLSDMAKRPQQVQRAKQKPTEAK